MADSSPRFRLENFVSEADWFHVAGTRCEPGASAATRHHHDFAEVFWVESGRGEHRVNHATQPLAPGTVVFVRPADRHSFRSGAGSALEYVNVAFAASQLGWLRERYYAADEAEWPWRQGPAPMALEVDAGGIERLSRQADYLSTGRQDLLELETFLLSLLSLVRRTLPPSPGAVPAWLSRAMDRFARGAELSGGPAELAQLAGRSSEHVNRTMRRLFGRTTTEYIHEVRLNRAGRLLRLTAQPIAEIALDCGYDNLGYFYRRFGERFGLTPRAYRMTNG